ncbi:phosphoribosylaminoimidazole carboxylase, chloroplastic-like [Raphanus sativus]|uniref:phosphoribosylaminoimidazole carboxylase n=1 Tax=Raphanus sativus TaxID=3726 RepID=A0A9W3BVY3_RAPSA|nr:phosphoribosylaminoimidazole carboxylase, chloroplastic-like [Raphanus sativus]
MVGLPLGGPSMRTPASNYGEAGFRMAHRLITRALSVPAASVHWYDKPGTVASLTLLPVIGVPVRGTRLDGVNSLLSIVQMPRGVPVATVAINHSTNAALLAIRMLEISDTDLVSRLFSSFLFFL